MSMPYRRLGRSGLKVSLLSFGSWVSFGNQLNDDLAVRCLDAAREGGVNFFDNAESYAGGESEAIMGRAIRTLGWARHEYVISSKFFWGIHDATNMRDTLNRKYLMQAVDGSLDRFGLDFLDLIFCHRSDPETPIEETVWTSSAQAKPSTGAPLSGPRTRSSPPSRSPSAIICTSPSRSSPSTTSSSGGASSGSTPALSRTTESA
jgi:aryl-alcohol dehydrogenase-like predicted oxidoreductase